jgi:hypothetical protein
MNRAYQNRLGGGFCDNDVKIACLNMPVVDLRAVIRKRPLIKTKINRFCFTRIKRDFFKAAALLWVG